MKTAAKLVSLLVILAPCTARADGLIQWPHPHWPQKVDLNVGESYTFTRRDGSKRRVTLVAYEVVFPRLKIMATVEVSGNGKTERHILQVCHAGVPVAINGLWVYGYAWKEADDVRPGGGRLPGFEQAGMQGKFPLSKDKDIGLAINDARATLFPDMDDYTYPATAAIHEGTKFQSFLDPIANSWAHAGYDMWSGTHLVALHDGVFWHRLSGNSKQKNKVVTFSISNGKCWTDPAAFYFTHVNGDAALVKSGTRVKKGTRLAKGYRFHMGDKSSFTFGPWIFCAEIWNNEHKDDWPAPRYWLVRGPFTGSNMASTHLVASEKGDLPRSYEPRAGASDIRAKEWTDRWKFADNFVNSVTKLGELLTYAPFSDGHPHFDRKRLSQNAVGYAAVYVYSSRDHARDKAVWLKWGSTYSAKIWLNGKSIFDNSGQPGDHNIKIDAVEVPLALRLGWNTFIIKMHHGNFSGQAWRFSAKIGDRQGRRMPELKFSTRDIHLRVEKVTARGVELRWNAPDHHGTFIDTYRLDVARDAAFTKLVKKDLDMGKVTRYTVKGLSGGTRCFLRVKPYNASDRGGTVYWRHADIVTVTLSGGTPAASGSLSRRPGRAAAGRAAQRIATANVKASEATAKLRQAIMDAVRGGRKVSVDINVAGRAMRGPLVGADERGVSVRIMGASVTFPWSSLSARNFYNIARVYSDDRVALAAYSREHGL